MVWRAYKMVSAAFYVSGFFRYDFLHTLFWIFFLLLLFCIYLAENVTTTPYSVTVTDFTLLPIERVTVTEGEYNNWRQLPFLRWWWFCVWSTVYYSFFFCDTNHFFFLQFWPHLGLFSYLDLCSFALLDIV